jgi:hypothetical protein
MSHATTCHVQLVLGNCTNLQLHATVAIPKISNSVEMLDFYIKWPMGQMIMVEMANLNKFT